MRERLQVEVVEVPASEAAYRGAAALVAAGATAEAAERVTTALVRNERRGLASHGLLRLPEYRDAIAQGTIVPRATPTTHEVSRQARIVDGRRGFGALSASAVSDALVELLEGQQLASVSLVNSNHIGVLRDVADPLIAAGHVVLGFVNFLGHGQRVIPPGGREGRLCTNPLLIAVPGDPPFVLDASTSTVAEGRIRSAWLAGEQVPDGWLVDADWRPVRDPERLYAKPPTAFMTPMGDSGYAYKGFGLALAVELLAGAIAGAGTAGSPASAAGNGGMFIALRSTLFARTGDELRADVEALRLHVSASADASAYRWPGTGAATLGSDTITLPAALWSSIVEVEEGKRAE